MVIKITYLEFDERHNSIREIIFDITSVKIGKACDLLFKHEMMYNKIKHSDNVMLIEYINAVSRSKQSKIILLSTIFGFSITPDRSRIFGELRKVNLSVEYLTHNKLHSSAIYFTAVVRDTIMLIESLDFKQELDLNKLLILKINLGY